MPAASIDLTDVQGLVRFGYKHHTEACYLLLRIRDAAAARAWCAAAQVATANDRPSDAVLQVAFTFPGLRALGLPDEVLAGFSSEFQSGMVGDESRSRRLGDVGSSAPENWCWGGPENIPDVLVMLFALPGKLEPFRRTVEDAGWNQAFELMRCLDTIDLKGFEPFGFKDGISQPEIDWPYSRNVKNQIFYTNVVAAGEFLLGYRNEYGKYTDRPLVDSTSPAAAVLPEAEDMPAKKDVGRNGSFVVMRTLGQDVRGFWDFLDAQAASDPVARKQLAEKMVGRRIEGDPLVEKSAVAIPGISADANRFTFGADSDGTRCPFGAHIRRANPRNGDFPNQPSWWLPRVWSKLGCASKGVRTDLTASTRFHRLLRRGREFGPGLTPEEIGLHFLCLNANISRQFEFVQNAWLMNTKFNGLSGESDPLLGNRSPVGDGRSTDNFTIPQENSLARCVAGLPQFITVRGGAYFFLPGIRALRYFGGVA